MEEKYGRYLTIKEVKEYLRMGDTRARQLMEKIGASRRIGERKIIYDREVIDQYIAEQGK